MKSIFPADRLSAEQIQSRRWFNLAVMNLSLVMVVMAVSSVNVLLPTLVRELNATATDLQWIVDSYAIVFAGLLLFCGALGDRFGRRGALLAGLLVYGVGTGMSGLAETAGQLTFWRGVTGIGAALVMPATLSIITNVFKKEERSKAIAVWAGFAGAGGAIGPVVSGLLLESFWWGSVFIGLLPIILLNIILITVFVPSSKDKEETSLDIIGAITSVVALGALLFAIIEGPIKGWTDTQTIAGFVIAAIAGGFFYWWESSIKSPMLPMEYFRKRVFSSASLAILLIFFAMFGLFFIVVQFMQFVLGYSALDAAIRTMPLALTLVVFAPRSPVWAEKYGRRTMLSAGMLIMGAAFVLFAQLTPDSGYLAIFIPLVIAGFGSALSMPTATDAILESVPGNKAGVGSAVNDTTREVGGALGIALLGSLVTSLYRDEVNMNREVLGEEVANVAEQSIGAAQAIASELGDNAVQLVTIANDGFTSGLSLALLVGAGILIAGSFLTLVWLPRK